MTLERVRRLIDDIDDAIVERLEERARLMQDVASSKTLASLPTFDPRREALVMERLAAKTHSFPREALRAVYHEIMSACRTLQKPANVAFLGPAGTFSHAAAMTCYGRAATFVEATSLAEVFELVATRKVAEGAVPIENAIGGSVLATVDGLLGSDLLIRAELEIDVSQCLLTTAMTLETIARVYSHEQALSQCRGWLARHLPQAELVRTPSTAAGVRKALNDPQVAAIAGRLAAQLHTLPVLRSHIDDCRQNSTRFVVVAHDDAPRTGVAGHRSDPAIAAAQRHLREHCRAMKHLGSYPSTTRSRVSTPPRSAS